MDPSVLVSISHTDEIGAAIIAKDELMKSIGLDIEKSSRMISNEMKKFFSTNFDITTNLSNLDIWCIKEAAYKAIYPLKKTINDGTSLLLSKIWIDNSSQTFGIISSRNIVGNYQCDNFTYQHQSLIVSKAFII